ncbi:histidine kinase [Flavobacterium agricola]|uniref:Histidine kinase n=1 Tax=Flavobacterium agricola TaxID=2870839 RepID=A0ABY6LZG9_9FLAO|nr:sensor histidine kinase [Flavobacterium agricola]UYW01717.1 histidine kinase [Flavobacterium agricola]
MRHFLSFFFLLCSFLTLAQDLYTRNIHVNNGLFSNNVNKTFVDSEGRVWIGSRGGLARKIMDKFELHPAAQEKKFNNIFDITEDAQGNIWAGSYGLGVLLLSESESRIFNTDTGLVSDFVRNLIVLNNRVYVGTKDGLSVISITDFTIQNFTPQSKDQKDDRSFAITSVFELNQQIYVSTLNDGLFKIEHNKLVLVDAFAGHRINFFKTINHELYFSSSLGFYKLNPQTFKPLKSYNLPDVREMIPLNGAFLLLRSSMVDFTGGLYQLKNETLTNFNTNFNLKSLEYKSFAYDSVFDRLYIGSNEDGLFISELNNSIQYNRNFKEIEAMLFAADKKFIFHENGLSILKNNQEIKTIPNSQFFSYQKANPLNTANKQKLFKLLPFYPEVENFTLKFYKDIYFKDSFFWVPTNIGIFKMDLNGNFVAYLPLHVYHFYIQNNQLVAPIPHNGTVLISNLQTLDHQYFSDFENGKSHPFTPLNVVDMAVTDSAVYFASALEGIYQFKNGKFTSWRTEKWFSVNKIKRITINSKGQLIVVSDFNDIYVFNLDDPKPTLIKTKDFKKIKGASTQFVEELDGVLYVGTNLGINVFYIDGNEKKYFFIDHEQGFTNSEKNTAISHQNQMYILSSTGYFYIDNSYFKNNRNFTANVMLAKFTINDTDKIAQITDADNIQPFALTHDENNIFIEFFLDKVRFPNKLSYYYQLHEDGEWIEVLHDRKIYLPYLAPGEYKLALKIIDNDSSTEITEPIIQFKIKEAFYNTLWFTVICLLVAGAISYISFSSFKKKKKKEIQFLELKHQVLISQLDAHFLFNILSAIKYLKRTADGPAADEVIDLFSDFIRKTLVFTNANKITLNQDISYLKNYVDLVNLGRDEPVEFTTKIAADINIDQVEVLPILMQPFVENCMKYAFPESISHPKITLIISRYPQGLKFELVDNGVGFQVEKQDVKSEKQSLGISIVANRLQIHNKITKQGLHISSDSTGTKVEVFYEQ